MLRIALSLVILFVLAPIVNAQTAGTITFTAQSTTGNGSVTPVLTWVTTPAAASCTASGDWTGTKAASGTQTLAAITQSATYNLSCTWTTSTATVSWTPATKNTDTSNYTDPKSVRIYYGQSANVLTATKDVAVPATSTAISPLASGTWFFTATSINQNNVESSQATPPVSFVVGSASGTKQLGITVNPVPLPPTNITVQ